MVTSMAILVRKKRLNKEGCSHLQFRGRPGRMLFSLPTADRRDLGVLAGGPNSHMVPQHTWLKTRLADAGREVGTSNTGRAGRPPPLGS